MDYTYFTGLLQIKCSKNFIEYKHLIIIDQHNKGFLTLLELHTYIR